MTRKLFWTCVVFLASATLASAQQFFSITAQTTGESPQSVTVGGNNLLNLTDNVIKAQSQFTGLAGQPFTAGLTWGGVKNAAVFSGNAAGTSVTLTLPQTGFTQTFTGASRSDVQSQIKTFLQNGGPDVVSEFLNKIDKSSPLGVVSGNPQALTEVYSMAAFDRFGIDANFATRTMAHANGAIFGADVTGGHASTSAGSEDFGMIDLYSGLRFSNNVALEASLPLEYRDNDGAATYMVGLQLGLPITILPDNGNNGFSWQLTPWGTIDLGASPDLAAGGLVGGGGGTSSLNLRTGSFVWTLADQWSRQTGLPVSYNNYHYDTSANQEIVTNGAKVTYNISPQFFIDGGAAYSDVLDSARVTDYLTATGGIGFRFGASSGLSVNYDGDFGHLFHDNGGDLNLWFAY